MKTLRRFSVLLLLLTLAGFFLWRFLVPLPDWFGRVNGVLMLGAVFAAVFSAVRLRLDGK